MNLPGGGPKTWLGESRRHALELGSDSNAIGITRGEFSSWLLPILSSVWPRWLSTADGGIVARTVGRLSNGTTSKVFRAIEEIV